VPYEYQIYIEYYDDEQDRFWFTTLDLTEPELLTPRQLDVAVNDFLESMISQKYPELEEYISEHDTTPIYTVESVIRT